MSTDVDAVVATRGDALRDRLERVEQRLRAIAAEAAPPLDRLAGDTIAAGGKRLRPLLVLLAAGEDPGDDAGLIRAAVAVELVHSATLVHDDVLDAASLRRGRETVWAAAGRARATATGDYLFARAFAELVANARPDELRVLSDASSALAAGELLQREDAFDSGVSVARYLHRCELKTARLFEAACRLGALEAGAPVDALGGFGRRIGLAFQLLDDVLDVSGPVERTGKPRGTDLLDGTVTLPFILARERDPSLRDARPSTPQEAQAVCDRIAATGALDEARERAIAMVAEAKRELPYDDDALLLVADSVVERYS
ncbi:polyprenyl synthetase family protein [Capillimicrobium parvum]|uniref:Heptaprenyl diphosphate synthase component 2 n=1 Tax=Capillimicrobium parvum TaxID=2884022 RepID=A0A9E6Y6M3_9ACTN|nr:polyprenyl synthetase family protein [Capillimicrobium parvum]UGS39296.1 Heptaprenyl diphosphate synthase component 2 [Capillimicrobium parvum]